MKGLALAAVLTACGAVTMPGDCGPVIEGPLVLNVEACDATGCQVVTDTIWTRYKECINPPRVVIVP